MRNRGSSDLECEWFLSNIDEDRSRWISVVYRLIQQGKNEWRDEKLWSNLSTESDKKS